MAVTHADLEKGRSPKALGSRLGASTHVLCGAMAALASILSLLAEATKSQVTWKPLPQPLPQRCIYTHSSQLTTAIASSALFLLSLSMLLSQAYMGLALCNPPPREKARPLYAWASNHSQASSLRWKAATFFTASWISYAVASVLLVIGVAVESQHAGGGGGGGVHSRCLVLSRGLFAVAGLSCLSHTIFNLGFYLVALRSRDIEQHEAMVREEVLHASSMVSFSSSTLAATNYGMPASPAVYVLNDASPALPPLKTAHSSPTPFSP